MKADAARQLLKHLTPAEREELDKLIAADVKQVVWRPLPGPQTMALRSQAKVIGFGGAAGGGKALPLDTPVPTPTGFARIGDLRPGHRVLDEQGVPCTVTAVSEVQMRPCYRLRFDDGTEIVATDNHRWVTHSASELARRAVHGTMRTTQQVADTLRTSTGRANHAIPVAGALQLPDAELLIPPYTLGAWLGDGSTAYGRINKPEPELFDHIRADGYDVTLHADGVGHGVIGLQAQLRDCGLLGDKHIPTRYLRGAFAQRLALLQGLLDTDGCCGARGKIELSLCCERLAHDAHELICSLGIKCNIRASDAKLYGRTTSTRWRMFFRTTLPVFRLKRKAANLPSTVRATTRFRYIVACDPVQTVPAVCIAVDSPTRQYLVTRRFLPTHNTDLAIGLALTEHHRSQVFRREGPQLKGIIDRVRELVPADCVTGNPPVCVAAGRQIEFNAMPNPGDELKYQGRPKDFLVVDEATNFLESQVRFVMGWVRSTRPGQRKRTLLTFNPPTNEEGRWVIRFFAPWLDKSHPLYPTGPGVLRYAYTDPATGKDVWIPDDDERRFVLKDGRRVYEFDPDDYTPEEVIEPESRTFVPSRLTDNPYLLATGYMSVLQALPEPLRSQMLLGDFYAGVTDDPWQVVPTEWVRQAQARWVQPAKLEPMDSVGVDVARGGADATTIAKRHGMWFAKHRKYPGTETPDGPSVAGLVIGERRDGAPVHIDVIGVGSSPYDFLREARVQVIGVNVAEAATRTDQSGRLRFYNLRSQLWWAMREALDPANNTGIALPPDPEVIGDLCAPKWELSGSTIKVEGREAIIKRIGRSPDVGSAYILALMDTAKTDALLRIIAGGAVGAGKAARDTYDPLGSM